MLKGIVRVVRSGPRKRQLVCPVCGGAIVLVDGRYWCDGALVGDVHGPSCGFVSRTLAELAAEGGRP